MAAAVAAVAAAAAASGCRACDDAAPLLIYSMVVWQQWQGTPSQHPTGKLRECGGWTGGGASATNAEMSNLPPFCAKLHPSCSTRVLSPVQQLL